MASKKHLFWGGLPGLALGLLAALVMVLGLRPTVGFAEEVVPVDPDDGGLAPQAQGIDPQATEYDLWVSAERVTSDNLSGNGWRYDADSNTLTLDGYSCNGPGYAYRDGYYAAIYAQLDLNIQLTGENSISLLSYPYGDNNYVYGIYNSGGATTITGDGKLTVECKNAAILSNEGDLTISGCTIEASTQDTKSYTIYAFSGDMVIADSTVRANSPDKALAYNGIQVEKAGMEITNSTVEAYGSYQGIYVSNNFTINSGTITAASLANYNNVQGIRSDGTITINGGTVTASTVGSQSAWGMAWGIYGTGVKIAGGTIVAKGAEGIYADKYNLIITDGTVTATGTNGCGMDTCGKLAITGGDVTASGRFVAVYAEKSVTIGDKIAVKAGDDKASAVDVTSSFAKEHSQKWAHITKLPAAEVTSAPTAKSLYANGSAQELVTAGAAEGGTMQYALGADATSAPADGWGTSIPTDTDAGIYFVWYRAVGDEGHVDSEATCVIAIIAEKSEPAPEVVPDAFVIAHVQRKGWMFPATDGSVAGTTGRSLRLEALALKLPAGVSGGIEYRGHVQRTGWEKAWKHDGQISGTVRKSRRMEAVQIRLTGEAADAYDVYYRVHAQRYGWMAWAKNGEKAGTQGKSFRLEAVQVVLVAKDGPAPAADFRGTTQAYGKAFAKK